MRRASKTLQCTAVGLLAVLSGSAWAAVCSKPVYLTFDIDGFDSSLIPATGTPEPAPAAAAPPASEGSPLAWSWPGAGKVLAGFVEGGNKGVDIGGKVGDPVLAAARSSMPPIR